MAKTNCISRFGYNENIADQQSIKCPCGKVGRFVMDKRVGHLKLCLDCMQYWLSEKVKSLCHPSKNQHNLPSKWHDFIIPDPPFSYYTANQTKQFWKEIGDFETRERRHESKNQLLSEARAGLR